MKKYDVIIIGAGSGGLVAAATACGMGAATLLIENRKMGGDCLNYGCVPSKTFLKSCRIMKNIKKAEHYGIAVDFSEVSLKEIMARVKSVISEIAPHDSVERFTALGADVVLGHGEIISATSVKVGANIYNTRNIIIATGSSPVILPIEGLDQIPFYTNETIFDLETLPKKMVVLGGGPIGLELGQGFAQLGSKVHIVDRSDTIFKKDEPEVSPILTKALEDDGVTFHMSSNILSISRQDSETLLKIEQDGTVIELTCDTLFIAIGRKPNTNGLGLENLQIETDKRGFIIVNDKLQTSTSNIYAIGDVRGKYQFTHTASYEAGVAIKNALIGNTFKTAYSNVCWTTYTFPEVAHVGLLEGECKDEGSYTLFIDISDNDRAKADDDRHGFVKLVMDKKRRVLGATIVSEKASEMLTQLSLMVTNKMHLSDTLSVIYQYPIQGEIIKALATTDFKDHVKPWQRKVIKKIVNRGDTDD